MDVAWVPSCHCRMELVYASSKFISFDWQIYIFQVVICGGSVSFQDEESDVVGRYDIFKVCEIISWYESVEACVR